MTDIEPGQTWEMYSRPDGRWVRVIVAKVEDAGVLLRYEGMLDEFLTVELADMLTKPEVFRPVPGA